MIGRNVLFSAARNRLASALALGLCVLSLSLTVWAHAILMDSTPQQNSTVKGPDFESPYALMCALMAAVRGCNCWDPTVR